MLQIIEKFAGEGAFNPEETLVLVAAFEEAWACLERSGVRFEGKSQRELARNTLGKFIIEEAKRGERDKVRLREHALRLYKSK